MQKKEEKKTNLKGALHHYHISIVRLLVQASIDRSIEDRERSPKYCLVKETELNVNGQAERTPVTKC
jgi:hypothetical protein